MDYPSKFKIADALFEPIARKADKEGRAVWVEITDGEPIAVSLPPPYHTSSELNTVGHIL